MATICFLESVRDLCISMILERYDGSIWTGLHTFSAIDAFFLIDVFDAFFIFVNGIYRTGILAGDRGVDDSVIGTYFLTESATDTDIRADVGFASLKGYSSFRTIHDTGTALTSPAKVRYGILGLYTCAASFMYDRKDIFFRILVVHCHTGKLG